MLEGSQGLQGGAVEKGVTGKWAARAEAAFLGLAYLYIAGQVIRWGIIGFRIAGN